MKRVNYIKMYHTLKSRQHKNGRLLGLDVGDKYVGLAISDATNKIASPLSVLVRTKGNIDLMATDFQNLVSKYSLAGFVIGYPFERIKENPDGASVFNFIHDLNKTGKLEGEEYTFWDESFTSKSVDYILRHVKLHPVQLKTMIDKFAAVNILQSYLDFVNRNQEKLQQHNIVGRQILREESDTESP